MIRIINEKDISSTIHDFEALCSYIMDNKPALTAKGALGTKACFDLNSLMTYSVPNAKKSDRMQGYPSIALYFSIALESGLLEPYPGAGQKIIVTTSDSYKAFHQMSMVSKYLYIFLAWMRYIDTDALYGQNMAMKWFDPSLIDLAFEQMGKIHQPAIVYRKDKFRGFFSDREPIQVLMRDCPVLLCHLCDLGLIGYDDVDMVKLEVYQTVVNKIWVTELGVTLSAACSTRRFSWVNTWETSSICNDNHDITVFENDFEQNLPGSTGFFKPFISCFPEGEVDADAINQLLFPQYGTENTVYEFRVSLRRDCFRIIQCSGSHTFEDFHLAIQKAFDFDNDHLYAFYMDGRKGSRRSINAPYCNEPPSADEFRIGEARMHVKQKILYLFDFGDSWRFDVTLVSICDSDTVSLHPIITESVGESPEQYPAFDE